MKIKEITQEYIEFDNGSMIEFDYSQSCCEHNYADFENIDSIAWDTDFNEELIFEENEDGYGFRFGSKGTPMFFIPCYSEQNGFYSSVVNILYKGKKVLYDVYGEIR